MKTINLVAPKSYHVEELVRNAPPELIAEVRASHDMSIRQAADLSLREAVEAFAATVEGKLLCITGVSPLSWERGCPWLLSTNSLSSYPRDLLKFSTLLLERWSRTYTCLTNWIDSRYDASLRWAHHVGFQIHPPEPYGTFKLPFHQIVYEAPISYENNISQTT